MSSVNSASTFIQASRKGSNRPSPDMPLATSEWCHTFLQSSDDVEDHQCGQIKKMCTQQDMRSQGLLSNLLPSCEERDIQQLETKTIRFGLECKLSMLRGSIGAESVSAELPLPDLRRII